MKNLIILGAGGFGREVFNWAKQSPNFQKEFIIKGFLDDNSTALNDFDYPVKVLDSIAKYQIEQDDVFICAIGSPKVKKELCTFVESKGGRFINIIHSSAIIGDNVKMGTGVIVCPGVKITCDVVIGDHVAINVNSCVGHDAVINSYCQISCFCDLNGFSVIGSEVFLGGRSSVLPGVKVAERVTVGAAALVTRSVTEEGITVIGAPAKKL